MRSLAVSTLQSSLISLSCHLCACLRAARGYLLELASYTNLTQSERLESSSESNPIYLAWRGAVMANSRDKRQVYQTHGPNSSSSYLNRLDSILQDKAAYLCILCLYVDDECSQDRASGMGDCGKWGVYGLLYHVLWLTILPVLISVQILLHRIRPSHARTGCSVGEDAAPMSRPAF